MQFFDGEKPLYKSDDNRSPRTIYGMLKKRVEDYLLMTYPNRTAILRLTKVIPDDPMRYVPWQKDIMNGKIVNMFTNTYVSPVKLEEVGSLISKLVQSKTSGVFQFGGQEEISNYDFATSWAVENDLDVTLIKPVLNYDSISTKHNSLVRYMP
jgi:dTDP-4-dehydrorhamnose reductase